MTELNEKIFPLIEHCRQLMDLYREINVKLEHTEKENSIMRDMIKEKEKIIVNLREQLTTQKIANSVVQDQDNENMKRKLNEYIKEIDQCLALLNN